MFDGDIPLWVDIGDVVLGSSRVFVLPSNTEIRGHLEEGAVAHFQVTMKVGFRLDDD